MFETTVDMSLAKDFVSDGNDNVNGKHEAVNGEQFHVLIGNRKWIKKRNQISIPEALEDRLIAQERLGHTAILAAINGLPNIVHCCLFLTELLTIVALAVDIYREISRGVWNS